ncbi:MAG TPA: hypothetical protein PJ988_18485 [Anaerolinea sp.]|nr:hypothetical protein [Anaerolinea sp.]
MKFLPLLILFVLALLFAACGRSTLSPPTPAVLGDSNFSGCAYLDANANGEIDNQDTPIGEMKFTITLSKGAGFGGLTSDKDGCASILIPSPLSETSWPVLARMEVPPALKVVPVGDNLTTLEYPDTHADFLFTQP